MADPVKAAEARSKDGTETGAETGAYPPPPAVVEVTASIVDPVEEAIEVDSPPMAADPVDQVPPPRAGDARMV